MKYPDAVADCIAAWGAGTEALARQGLADQATSEAVSLLLLAGCLLTGIPLFILALLARAFGAAMAVLGVVGGIMFAADFRALGNSLEACLEAAARAKAQGP